MDIDLHRLLPDVVYYVVFHVTRALLAFLQRDSYLYWPFLLSTLVIVLWVSRRAAGATGGFFSRKLWWHRSARADYRVYLANALVFPVVMAPLLLGDLQLAQWLGAASGLQSAQPMAPAESALAAGFAGKLLFTVVFFVAFDFGRFLSHTLLHDIPLLWEFHKVHHSAEVLTPMTAYRAHPLELLIMTWGSTVMTGLVTWVFNLAGGGVSLYTFLGMHVALWAFSLIDNLKHSPVWVSYGPRVGRWLISPAHHQLHHSIEPRHWGCNRGSNLAIWDRLWGTLYVPGREPEEFRMGLGDGTEPKWNSVWRMYLMPFAGCARWAAAALRGKSADKEPGSPAS